MEQFVEKIVHTLQEGSSTLNSGDEFKDPREAEKVPAAGVALYPGCQRLF